MTTTLPISLVPLVLWVLAATPAMKPDQAGSAALGDSLHLPGKTVFLRNGMAITVHEDHRAPRIVMHLLVRAGAAQDPQGVTGTAHLLEHMSFTGSASVPAGAFDAWLEAAGGESNAWTEHDYTAYSTVFPPGALHLALVLESDRLATLGYSQDPSAFRAQRQIVVAERSETFGLPHGRDVQALNAALYPESHPYHHPVLGWRQDLENMSADSLTSFWMKHYTPASCSLVLAGDLDTDHALDAAIARFGSIPAREPAPAPDLAPPPSPGGQRMVLLDNVADRTLYLAWLTVPRGHPDEPALAVAARLLTDSSWGGLAQMRIFRHFPFNKVQGWTSFRRLSGEFVLRVSSSGRPLSHLLRAVDGELERLERRGPTQDQLARLRAGFSSAYLRALEPLEDRAAFINDCLVTWGEPDCMARDLERYLAVSAQDIRGVVGRYLDVDSRLLLSVVPGRQPGAALAGSRVLEFR